jgi:selenocysteine lyase/cysteine desulfurase
LRRIPGLILYGPDDPQRSTAVVSFTLAGRRVSGIGQRLDEQFGILCRVGLHCAPAAHRSLGTFPEGTVRLAPGIFTTPEEIAETIRAVEAITRS